MLVDGPGSAWEILGNGNVARAPELFWAGALVAPRILQAIVWVIWHYPYKFGFVWAQGSIPGCQSLWRMATSSDWPIWPI
jgi:hypothetical protein